MFRHRLVLPLAASLLAVPLAVAQQVADPHAHHREMMKKAADDNLESVPRMNIPDLVVLDQDGNERHFYSDLVKDKVVAVNFIFTTCTTICPPLGATFGRLQQLLGERAGRDVFLLSISVDPAIDTPPRMKAWGAKFGAGPGWTLITGPKKTIDKLLAALGLPAGPKEDHPPLVLIGNEAAGHWTRAYGFSSATRLVELIETAVAAGGREQASHAGQH